MNLQELKKQYEFICNEYIKKFYYKQKIQFDGWIGDEVGGIACFESQYYFNLSDIILDLNTKQQKWLILEWQDDGIEEESKINYKSYTMGLRYSDIKQKTIETITEPLISSIQGSKAIHWQIITCPQFDKILYLNTKTNIYESDGKEVSPTDERLINYLSMCKDLSPIDYTNHKSK